MAGTEATKESISSEGAAESAALRRARALPSEQKAGADCFTAYCKSKCEEWSLKGAYPLTEKVAQLMSDPAFYLAAWPPSKNYYSFLYSNPTQQEHQQHQQKQHQSHHFITKYLTETLQHLGWTAIDARDTRAFDRLQLAAENLLLVGPEVGAALRQRTDSSRFACSLAVWEQRLPCLDSYWQLYEAVESFELGLLNFSTMGLLLNSPQHRCSFQDFLLPIVHLGEVWGHRLSRFLKAHETYRLIRATPTFGGGKPGSGAPASGSPASAVVAELVFRPSDSGDKSGRRRLSQLEEMKESDQGRDLLALSGTSWFSLALQACPVTQMLVIGRRFALETFLLLAPRRNHVEFGFAAFFHPGLVRVQAPIAEDQTKGRNHSHHHHQQQQQQHFKSLEIDEEQSLQHRQQQQEQIKVIEPSRDQTTFTWLPEQLSDYLSAAEPHSTPETKDWLSRSAYPQIRAACAYLATALAQQVTDSAYARYQLLRLSFVVGVSCEKHGKEVRRVHLDDISQRLAPLQSTAAPAIDYCESLVLPRLMHESALILSELLVRSGHTADLPARELTTPQNMRLVYDSVDPGVQREILAHDCNCC